MKASYIVIISAIILAIIGAILLFPPITTVECTLNTVVIDKEGNQTGTAKINLKLTIINEEKAELTIDPFEHLTSIQPSTDKQIRTVPYADYLTVSCSAWDIAANDMAFCQLCFSPDLQRFIFCDMSSDIYYIASLNETDTLEELKKYFISAYADSWPTPETTHPSQAETNPPLLYMIQQDMLKY